MNIIRLTLIFVVTATGVCYAQSPSIAYATSSYKTSAGAIGPSGIISTSVYGIKLKSSKTILLDSAVINGLKIVGDGIIIPTNKSGTIAFTISISTHQQETVWFSGALGFQDMSVGVNVYKASTDYDKINPAIVLYLRNSNARYKIIKEKFDQTHSQYNK